MLRSFRFGVVAVFLAAVALLALARTSYGQSGGPSGEPVFPPASRIGLAPPPGFVPAPDFPGFRHSEKRASILIAELPGSAFDTIEKQVSADLEKDTPVPVTRTDVTFKDGGTGFVLHGRPNSPQGPVLRWTLVARIGGLTAVVTAIVPEQVQDVVSDAAIRASLATLTVRPVVPLEEQLSVLPFAMHDLGGFRIVRVEPGGAALLTDGPNDVIEIAEQPLLLVAISPLMTQPQPSERDGFARRLFGEIAGLKEVRVMRSEPLRVAGQQGHEILAEAKDAKTAADVTAVQWLRFGTGTLLRIVGIARKDAWPALYPRFRQVRDGIGPK
ncbi:MAG: hypothetical protein IRZ09_10160 [Variibacter sp.]|nr:hypothetical protein [Variibacter sp.]